MNARHHFALSALLILLAVLAAGCAAGVDTSKARSRGLINQGVIVPAEEIRVAEYLNYYEQRFPVPTDAPLGLDLRLGNPQIATAGGEVWLQIGLQAREAEQSEDTRLNLALVLDRSGSMDQPDKMPYLKESLRVFLESLDPDDIVAIVAYDTEAEVLLPAQSGGDGRWIRATIDRLRPGGTTNLHGGMMLGFREVERNYDIRRNNRVILMTDGIANEGVADPQRIAADALAYNQRGVYLSTVGLGLDFNDQLLSKLGKHSTGKSCLYIKKLEDVDMDVLKELVKQSVEHMSKSSAS